MTIELHPEYQNVQAAEFSAFGMKLRCSWEKKENCFLIYRSTARHADSAPELALILQEEPNGELHFAIGGFLSAARFPTFEHRVWLPADHDGTAGYHNYFVAGRERRRWRDHGELKPLPDDFPQAFAELMALLFRDREHEICAILKYPRLSGDVIGAVAASLLDGKMGPAAEWVLPTLGEHPHLSAETQERLFALPKQPAVWRAVACNASAGGKFHGEYLRRIREGNQAVPFAVARDRQAPREAWELALAPREREVMEEFARNDSAPADLLEAVGKAIGTPEQPGLAANPNTPPTVLRELANSKDKFTLWSLQRNPSAPADAVERVLATLANSHGSNERDTAARDVRLAPELIDRLSRDVSIQVRIVLAMNAAVPATTLERLADDPYRMVSERARDNIKQRFPELYAQKSPVWMPLNALNPNQNLTADFTDAVKAGDVTRAQQILSLSEDPEIVPSYGSAAAIILRENFEACQALLREVIAKGGASAQEAVIRSNYLKAEQIGWLQAQGLLSPPWCDALVISGTQKRRNDLLAACKQHGLMQSLAQRTKDAALCAATATRQNDLVDFWLHQGARADAPVQPGLAAVDIAARMYSIETLRRLDAGGKYRAFFQQLRNDFPAAPRSTFLGQWSNRAGDGFSRVEFILAADATGYMGASVASFPILWTPVDPDSLRMVIISRDTLMKDNPIILRYDRKHDALRVQSAPGDPMLVKSTEAGPFYRVAATASSAVERR